MMKKLFFSAAFLSAPLVVCAQAVRPDSGQILQGNLEKKPTPPAPTSPSLVPKFGTESSKSTPGGPEVLVSDIRFEGNTVFGSDQLRALIADKLAHRYDLAGMKQLAELVTTFYRNNGYPFAKVVVPVQEFDDGVLKLKVLEGRYANVRPVGSAYVVEGASKFLERLRTDDLIFDAELESTMLILDDLPGVNVTPIVSPGAKIETADLDVAVRLENRRGGEFGVDNYGSRFTGTNRIRGQYYENSLLLFGDKASLDFLATNHEMMLGTVSYDRPLGGMGLRAELSYSATSYVLAEEYAPMGVSGVAHVWSARLSYPLIRSQAKSLYFSFGYQHKELRDNFSALSSIQDKSSDLLVSALRFDVRDNLVGGGLTYGSLTATSGHLNLFGSLVAADATTAQKAGQFNKVALDVARMQWLPDSFLLYLRYSAQWANQNLDSSEKLGAGGALGVRSYPMGEATGDVGWLGQVELRYQSGDHNPYLFFDSAHTNANYRAWDAASAAERRITGYGLGLRSILGKWSSDIAVARRGQGGESESDKSFGRTAVWASLTRSF